MKKRKIALLTTVSLVFLFCSIVAYRTASNQGAAAVEAMTDDELAFLDKVKLITGKMNYDDVVGVLGEPNRSGAGVRPSWRGPGDSALSQVAVYFTEPSGTVRKIRWLKIGSFIWEIQP